MSLIQPLAFGASKEEWESWMMALTQWAQNLDNNTAGLPITKQGIQNLVEMTGSTSNALLMYYVSTLPTQGSFDEQIVYNGEDGRIYVWNAAQQLWLPTGATAFKQLSGFVEPAQVLFGNQLDIVTNGSFTNDTVGQAPNGWSSTSSYSNAPVLVQAATSVTAGCPTSNCILVQGRDTYFTSGNGFDVKPGDYYFLEGYIGSDGSTPGANIGLYFPAVGSLGPTWLAAASASAGQSGWAVGSGLVQVPSWANRAQVWLMVNSFSSQSSAYGNTWFTGIECVKASSNLQTYQPFGTTALTTAGATVFTGSFVTGYASIILVGLDAICTSSAGINISISLRLDGNEVDLVTPNFIAGGAGVTIPVTMFGITDTPGSHTFSIFAYSGNGSWTQQLECRSITVQNFMK